MIETRTGPALPLPEDDDEEGRLPRPIAGLIILALSASLWTLILLGLRSL